MTPGPTLEDLIRTVRSDAASDDVLDQLATASRTVAEMEEVADAALSHFVDQCRRSGHSWSAISKALGVTKQAAHKRFSDLPPTLERFTQRARTVLPAAVGEALRLGHNYVGTEHLLLAVLNDAGSLAAKVLADVQITHAAVEERVVAVAPPSPTSIDAPPFTPRATACIERSVAEALQLGHNYVGTEHLLLAMFNDADGLAAKILTQLGTSREDVRRRVVEKLSGLVSGA
jgi:hypothetical protein